MIQLTEAANGRVLIGSQPYQRGLLRVRYALDGTVSIRDPFGPVLAQTSFSQFVNPETGNPFGTLNELKAFIDANFFRVSGDAPTETNDGFPYAFPFTLI